MLLRGKVAVVSGLDPGLGRDISLALAREGADIVISGRREPRMMTIADEIASVGRKALCVPVDITDAQACAALATRVADIFGRVDTLVHNTAIIDVPTSFEDVELPEWRTAFEADFFGTLQLTQALLPLLKKSGESRVVMMNTAAVPPGDPTFGAVAASKGAVAAVINLLARDLGQHGIRVNGVHPGVMRNGPDEALVRLQADRRGMTVQQVYDELAERTYLGYVPSSAEIADAVVFFASPLSRGVTGQSLHVDAGHAFV